jgi:DNA helicase-2/ATP-dependent DNA helicase PcrA
MINADETKSRYLEIYAYLIEQRYGYKVSAMHFYYPKENSGNPRIIPL